MHKIVKRAGAAAAASVALAGAGLAVTAAPAAAVTTYMHVTVKTSSDADLIFVDGRGVRHVTRRGQTVELPSGSVSRKVWVPYHCAVTLGTKRYGDSTSNQASHYENISYGLTMTGFAYCR